MENILSPKISACMIVKNEEEFLPNCLNSIKDVVDEIIIVDTGSTDNTVTIAKEFKAKVYHHPWNDSFSEARNHCLNHASGDWILQIDADEELEQADIPKLRLAISDNRYNGIIIAIQSIIKDGMHTFYHPRIFRRGKGFYKDIIHEQTIIEGERLPTEIRLYHYGYNLDEKKMRIKWQRTTHLLKKQIAQNKHDSFAWFNLVRNYRIQDSFQDGINAGEEALKIMSPVP
ncbi:MAG: glycosyltransferase family 2 protein, partial [Candidatus Brocadiales bacterium]|nr:glycosyltransferase family 2 protein [Candidatus Brocadiales bacterium]